MVKIFISSGHDNNDPGAVKYVVERDEVWKIANFVAEELNKVKGVTAYREAWTDKWRDTVNKCNSLDCDYFFEFHENAGRGNGAECIIHNTGNQHIADEIKEAFLEIGQEWRRTIVDPTYWVLKYTHCPAMIVECAFVDNKEDIEDWDEDSEKRVMAKSLAKHILKVAGVEADDTDPVPSKPVTPKPSRPKKVAEDGIWGRDTTRKSQRLLGTPADGIVSEQLYSCMKYLPGMHKSSWEFVTYGRGSVFVIKLQKLVGATQDGYAGYDTVVKLQKFLKTRGLYNGEIDGIAGYGTVKGWQKFINKNL